jgi:hypothetical protein
MIEVYVFCGTVLIVGLFWVHRKYPKPVAQLPPEMDTQQFMKDFHRFQEEFKAFKINYTGSETLFGTRFDGGPNG